MKKIGLILLVLLMHLTQAQEIKFNPRTGDVDMDAYLKSVNEEATKDLGAFTANMVKGFGMIKADVEKLLKDMFPGDVFMTVQVANSIGRPVTEVSGAYQKSKDKGWGAIAKEMGIKPGSPEFHKLKKAMKRKGTYTKGGTSGSVESESAGETKGNGKGKSKGKGKK